jgi:hypothetical protein
VCATRVRSFCSNRLVRRTKPSNKNVVCGALKVELVPTLMIDDAETKMRTAAFVLFELNTSVPFCHALQICELIYVDIYLARSRQVLR